MSTGSIIAILAVTIIMIPLILVGLINISAVFTMRSQGIDGMSWFIIIPILLIVLPILAIYATAVSLQ